MPHLVNRRFGPIKPDLLHCKSGKYIRHLFHSFANHNLVFLNLFHVVLQYLDVSAQSEEGPNARNKKRCDLQRFPIDMDQSITIHPKSDRMMRLLSPGEISANDMLKQCECNVKEA